MGNHCTLAAECDRLSEAQHQCLGQKDSKHFESELRDSQSMINHLLLRAAQEDASDAVQACIDRGAYLETRRPFAMSPDGDYTPEAVDVGLTPLMYAAQTGGTASCEFLLKARADVNAEDEDGLRPLHFSAMASCQEVCELLLRCRADPGAKDSEGRAALDVVPLVDRTTRRQQELWRQLFVVAAAEVAAAVASAGDDCRQSLELGSGQPASLRRDAKDEEGGFFEVASPGKKDGARENSDGLFLAKDAG